MTDLKPVKVSASAHAALAFKMRQWSGWGHKGTLVLGDTETSSPYASCEHDPGYTIRINPDNLLLNPNRVLKTVTPFRLRQEALLTGALLHEAGHARHSHWQPGRYGNPAQAMHGSEFDLHVEQHEDGSMAIERQPVTDLVLDFAMNLEEARVEGLIAAEATDIGAHGLAWTMRCSAIRVLPFTDVSLDPDQAVLDVLTSWILRAGRQIATAHHFVSTGRTYQIAPWVGDFNSLLNSVVTPHLKSNKVAAEADMLPDDDSPWVGDPNPDVTAELNTVMGLLYEGLTTGDEADAPGSTFMVDISKKILDLLFPPDAQENLESEPGCAEEAGQDDAESDDSDDEDSDGDESPSEGGSPGDGDEDADPDDTEGESDDDGQDGEGDTEPEDPGSGTDPGAGDSGQDKAEKFKEALAEHAANKQAQAKTQARLDKVEGDAAKQSEQEQAAEVADPSEGPDPTQAPDEETDDTEKQKTHGAGEYRGRGVRDGHYRQPTKEERDIKRGAETFLRNIIDPSERGKLQVTDSPSATVDGAALAAWKAGGQTTAPRFFRRVKRTEQPAPPVKIAIMVDRSFSMDALDKPSSLLSWALSAACLDLRNFAGRGIQVESTLIHWGSDARVVQPNGKPMPGIHESDCSESTAAMAEALELVAQEMPGFFDPMTKPENRLLVQFTDWELAGYRMDDITRTIGKALTNGVNMLSIVPDDYSWRGTSLDGIVASVRNPKGRNSLLQYNPYRPAEVWSAAAEVLSSAAVPGF